MDTKKRAGRVALMFNNAVAYSMLQRYVPFGQDYLTLKLQYGWNDIQCFEHLTKCVSKCKQECWQPKQLYNRDIQYDLANTGMISSNFKVFYQNIAGISHNEAALLKLLDSNTFDLIMLNETHSPSLSSSIHTSAKRNRYVKIELPARRFASMGRFCGGSVVFIKRQYFISNVTKNYHDWGEEIALTINKQYTFHCIYRNPKSKLVDMANLFTELLNTSQFHLFVGDFNSELLTPSTRLRTKCVSVDLQHCKLPSNSMTQHRQAEARRNVKFLCQFPLSVLSTFTPTSAASRCIDFCLINKVAARSLHNLKCLVQRGQNIMVSDHKFFQFGFDMSNSTLQLPTSTGCTLRIGKRAIRNQTIGFNALTSIFRLSSKFDWLSMPASLGIAWFAVISFLAFKVSALQYSQSFPSQTPSYALIYRKFRAVVNNTPSLREQRSILRQSKWKYNILSGSAMTRSLLRTQFNHFSFQQALKQPYNDTVVQCSPQQLTEYYTDFFNGKFSREPTHMDADFLQDYVCLPEDAIVQLGSDITLTELRNVITTMNPNSAPGVFGMELGCIQQLVDNDSLGDIITTLLNRWIREEVNTELFLAIVSAIPKPKKPPDIPQNLRPISVTSIWYRLVAKTFAERLKPYLSTLYSENQHGFCPNRNVLTALVNVKLCTEMAISRKTQLYLLQCDVSKAYDNVHRGRLKTVLRHIGIFDTPLCQFITRATNEGMLCVTTPHGLSAQIPSTRGIRQGCPASPILFAILLAGLERRLKRLHPTLGVHFNNQYSQLSNYADDMKLFGTSISDINVLFSELQHFLHIVGLDCQAQDCSLMVVNGKAEDTYRLQDTTLTPVSELRFLGVVIDKLGNFKPKKTDFGKPLWALFNRVKNLGMTCYPTAYIKAYQTFIQPAVLFGIEIWGAKLCLDVLREKTNPFVHDQYTPIMRVFKQVLGLHSTKTFNAPLYRLLGIKPPFIQAFQQIIKLIKIMSPQMWSNLVYVAGQVEGGYAHTLVALWEFHSSLNNQIAGSLAYAIEETYWQLHSVAGGRHAMFFEIFGHGPMAWSCIKHKTSLQTLRSIAQFVCLSWPYFWEDREGTCEMCNTGKQTLSHLLLECPATTRVCNKFGVPKFAPFLKQFLLSCSGIHLSQFIADLKSVLNAPHKPLVQRSILQLGSVVEGTSDSYMVRFDGSFSSTEGAGIGVTIHRQNVAEPCLQISVPVQTKDAQRTEMMGATIGALIVSLLPGKYVTFEGDSAYICGLLNGTYFPRETFFYNCVELSRDFLTYWHVRASWISRALNGDCDQLARQAVASGVIWFETSLIFNDQRSIIEKVLEEFVKHFVS